MPRVSAEEKSKSHERILVAASRMLREQGLQGTGVGDVMSAAGMTHGGFYKHFGSREEMLAAAVDYAADSVLSQAESSGDEKSRDKAVDDYIALYLSDLHRGSRATGCPLAAIAGEALREDGPVRDAAERALFKTVRLLSPETAETNSIGASQDTGLATAAVLVGTIVLARLARDDGEARRMLEVGVQTVRMLRKGDNE